MAKTSVERTLFALADPTRRGVVELLRDGPRRAGEIASMLAVQKPALTRHLRLLRESGLVREDGMPQDARVRVYHLQREPLCLLRGWIEELESFWTMQLEGFKAHAEDTRGRKRRRSSTPQGRP